MRYAGWGLFIVAVMALLGGMIGGFLSVGLLDDVLFERDESREVILQESTVIVDMVEELEPSVVSIEAEGEAQTDIFGREFDTPSGVGTGVVVSEDGIVLTNRHVVPEGSDITVTTNDGELHDEVTVLDRDPFIDIAYVQLPGDGYEPAEIGDSDQVSVGQRVIAIGNALGEFSNTVTSGIISGIGRPVIARGQGQAPEQLQGLFQTDAAINPGNSGGPLLNIDGQVVGINTAVARGEAEGIGFAIPINQVTAGLETIREEGRLIKPFLGVRYVMLTPELAEEEGLDISEGALLVEDNGESSVVSGGPGEAAGLQAGDVITHIDDQELTRENNLATALSRYQAGDEVEVRYVRDGEERSAEVELDEAPDDL